MKKTVALFLILAMLALSVTVGWSESNPLLYEVKDGEGHVIYLLGTIHVGGEDMYPLSDAVWNAYAAADVLAVEVDVVTYSSSLLAALRSVAALIYGPGDSAENHLSPETYALGIEKLGLSAFVLKRLQPAGWYSLAENYMIEAVGLSALLGVDYSLLEQAHDDHKRIDELESMDEQMDTLLSLPESVLDLEIQMMLAYPEEAGLALKSLYDAWRAGDAEVLETMLSAQEEMDGDYDEYNEVLLGSRNAGFEEKALQYLQNGETALIAIGAAHILGEDGLATRLARAGCEVNEIGR